MGGPGVDFHRRRFYFADKLLRARRSLADVPKNYNKVYVNYLCNVRLCLNLSRSGKFAVTYAFFSRQSQKIISFRQGHLRAAGAPLAVGGVPGTPLEPSGRGPLDLGLFHALWGAL